MTLVAAWLRGGVAYVVADTAVTFDGMPEEYLSTFGEMQLQYANGETKAVEERIPKILRLSPDALIAFAGSVRHVREFAERVRNKIAETGNAHTAIEKFAAMYLGTQNQFEVVAAYRHEGVSHLRLFSNDESIRAVEPGTICLLGSGQQLAAHVVPRLRRLVEETDDQLNPDLMLIAALAQLQALGMANHLPTFGVGGVFLGASVCPTAGVAWQENVTYVVHTPQLAEEGPTPNSDVEIIDCKLWEDSAHVVSSIRKGMSVLPSPWAPQQTPGAWIELLTQLYPEDPTRPITSTPFFVFLNTNGRKAVVLQRRPAQTTRCGSATVRG